tara:strand:- start:1475 stop:1930 length:456 start_codon:yes stop_codon:yes gene_type:complete
MINKLFILFLILILPQCGFSPVYKDLRGGDFQLIITERTGDKKINNIIAREIKRNTTSNEKNIYYIKINTNYKKIVISKDSKGLASNYQIKLKATFQVKIDDINKEIIFEEKQNMKKISDNFDEKNYENSIKNNFGLSVVNKLKLKLLNLE